MIPHGPVGTGAGPVVLTDYPPVCNLGVTYNMGVVVPVSRTFSCRWP